MKSILWLVLAAVFLSPSLGYSMPERNEGPTGEDCGADVSTHAPLDPAQIVARKAAIEQALGNTIGQATFSSPTSLVTRITQKGFAADVVTLAALGVPNEAFRFYDPRTGAFRYTNNRPYKLDRENGDQPFDSFRLVVRSSDLESETPTLLDDYLGALSAFPGTSLIVSVTPFDPFHNQLCSGAKAAQMFERKLGGFDSVKDRVKWTVSRYPLHPWTTDDSKSVGDGTLLAPTRWYDDEKRFTIARRNNLRHIEEEGLAKLKRTVLTYDGGDLVVGSNRIITGTMTVMSNRRLLQISADEAIAALQAEFGTPVYFLDVTRTMREAHPYLLQVLPHTDLHIAIARDHVRGDEVALISSPQKAADTLRARGTGTELKARQLAAALVTSPSAAAATIWNRLNADIIRDLERLRYRIVPLPGFGFPVPDGDGGTRMVTINYTNVQLGGRLAMVPKMGLGSTDTEAKEIFESMGYTVQWGEGAASHLDSSNGGTRCGGNAMRRPLPN